MSKVTYAGLNKWGKKTKEPVVETDKSEKEKARLKQKIMREKLKRKGF